MTFLIAGAFSLPTGKESARKCMCSENDKEMKNRIRRRRAACGKRKPLLNMSRGDLLILSNNIVSQNQATFLSIVKVSNSGINTGK